MALSSPSSSSTGPVAPSLATLVANSLPSQMATQKKSLLMELMVKQMEYRDGLKGHIVMTPKWGLIVMIVIRPELKMLHLTLGRRTTVRLCSRRDFGKRATSGSSRYCLQRG